MYGLLFSAPSCTVGIRISARHDQLIRQTVVITHTCRPSHAAAAATTADLRGTGMGLEMHAINFLQFSPFSE